jgi:serine/threonine protein kinase
MGYIAPEIVHEKDFNEKSDIFSIGCMMYYLFTGQKLFETRSFHELKEMTEDDEYLKRRLQRLKGNNMWLVKLI